VRKVVAVRPRPYTALLTNGWMLSEEKARGLREAGLEQVSISVDYLGAEHDAQRGLPGLYERIATRMPAIRAVGFHRIVINTVIMESNLDQVVELARVTAGWGVLHSFSCYSTLKTDGTAELVGGRRMARLRRVVGEIKRLKRREGHIVSSDFYLDGVVAYFENGGRIGDRCRAAGRRFYHIDPWGYAKICPEFEPFAHWTEMDRKPQAANGCTRCWYGCRGENEAPITLARLKDLRI
jgi:MoaA/NifB/PqqE/SkfB family radical SAM enzyme